MTNIDLLALADRIEVEADEALDKLLDTLGRMNADSRKYPVSALGSSYPGGVGGLYTLAAKLRERARSKTPGRRENNG